MPTSTKLAKTTTLCIAAACGDFSGAVLGAEAGFLSALKETFLGTKNQTESIKSGNSPIAAAAGAAAASSSSPKPESSPKLDDVPKVPLPNTFDLMIQSAGSDNSDNIKFVTEIDHVNEIHDQCHAAALRYKPTEFISAGRLGEIFCCELLNPGVDKFLTKPLNSEMDQECALKKVAFRADSDDCQDFQNEVSVHKRLNLADENSGTDYVVKFLGSAIVKSDSEGFIAMERCHKHLGDHILSIISESSSENSGLSEKTVLDIFLQVLGAVQHCTKNKVYHGDLRLKNFLVKYHDSKGSLSVSESDSVTNTNPNGSVTVSIKIADFDQSKCDTVWQKERYLCNGKDHYFAPEKFALPHLPKLTEIFKEYENLTPAARQSIPNEEYEGRGGFDESFEDIKYDFPLKSFMHGNLKKFWCELQNFCELEENKLVLDNSKEPKEYNAEKADVWSLGIMLLQMLRKCHCVKPLGQDSESQSDDRDVKSQTDTKSDKSSLYDSFNFGGQTGKYPTAALLEEMKKLNKGIDFKEHMPNMSEEQQQRWKAILDSCFKWNPAERPKVADLIEQVKKIGKQLQ